MMAMVAGTLANGAAYYDIARGTGYDSAEVLARTGYYVLLVDLPGTGASYRPADGRTARTPLNVDAVLDTAYLLAPLLGVTRGVDLYGETGVGTNAALLASTRPFVRTVSMSAAFYMQYGPVAAASLFNPGYFAFLDSLPDGYQPQDPSVFPFFFGEADPAVQAEATAACLGPTPWVFPTGVVYELHDHWGPDSVTTLRLASPMFDAVLSRVPAFIIQGSPDFLGSEAGTAEMVAAYGTTGGGHATMLTIPGASHLMRYDVAVSNGPTSPFWSAELAFLAAH
jgi:pimeloyl-ACP methyl ester carboxylesterase